MADRQISPGIAHPLSRLCASDIRHGVPYTYRALHLLACSPRRVASYPLPVRRASALPPASFRRPVTRTALAVQLTVPRVGSVEDFHLQEGAPCRAHKRERPAERGVLMTLASPSVFTQTGGAGAVAYRVGSSSTAASHWRASNQAHLTHTKLENDRRRSPCSEQSRYTVDATA